MINYIIQIVFFQVLFLAVYDLFLQKETFFKWNRVYLLLTPILSFVIPLLRFESLRKTVPQEYVILLPTVVLNPQKVIEQTPNSVETLNYLNVIFFVGVLVLCVLFFVKLYRIIRLIISNNVIKKENYTLILLNNQAVAFSFFNYIFIDKKLIEKGDLHILEHELVHSKHYHTLDLLFFELFKILMWFNPMIYIYQKRITLLHEYISDAEVVKETDKNTYFNKMLATTFNVENISFINQFYKHSLIKKRIIMITKRKSQKMKQLKYLVLIPLLASMLFYTSCTNEVDNTKEKTAIEKLQMIMSKDGTSGSLRTPLTTYFFKKNDDGSVFFYDRFGNQLDITQINDPNITFSNNGSTVSSNGKVYLENKIDINEGVDFAVIDKSPIFLGCEGKDQKEARDCFNREIRKFVAKNFNGELAKNLGLSGKQKIYIKFKITKSGNVEVLGARAPKKELEEEARRVVTSLPTMIPGEYKGEKVNTLYMLPIAFDVR